MRSIRLHMPARAEDVARWDRGEASTVTIKENRGRAVWRVAVGEPALYVKRFPPSLLRDRARKEARLLQALAGAGIPCPRLVATARDAAGAYVITEEIAGAQVLKTILGRDLLVRLARLARKMHDAGFDHGDFHVGNVLARGNVLYVLDVHRARGARSLSRRRRVEAIAFAALSFRELVPQTEVLRFFRAYGFESKEELLRAFESLRRCGTRYFRDRERRCVMDGTGFGIRDGVYHRKGVDLDALLASVRTGGRVIQSKAKETLSRLEGGLFLKRTKPARALAIWKNAHALAVRGIATPRLDACGRGWVAGEWLDAPNLYDFVTSRYSALGRAERNDFLFRLARSLRRAHARGVFHQDLKATNVLVSGRGFPLVDLDRMKFPREVADRDRMFNLAQLNAAIPEPVTRADRLRFLRHYLGRDRERWKRRRAWIGEIMRVTVARAHRWPPQGGRS